MAGKNDILATAGVDLSAFEAGIAKLTSRLDAVEKAGSRAASGIEKVDKAAQSLKNIQIADHFVNAIGQIASGGGQAQHALTSMSASLAVASNDFTGTTQAMNGMAKATGISIDFMSRMPGKMGVIGAGLQVVSDALVSATNANYGFSSVMARGAGSTQGMIEQSARLAQQQQKEAEATITNQDHLESMASARSRLAKDYEKQTQKQIALEKDTSAGAGQRLQGILAEADARQQIEDLKASQTSSGVISDAGAVIVKAGTAEIMTQLEMKKKSLALSESQEKSEVSLNQSASVRGVTMSDAIEAQTSYQTELNAQLKIAQGLFAANSVQVTSLEKALHESALAVDEINFAQEQNLTSAKGNNEALEKTITGDKSAVASAKEKTAYEIARNQAIKDGNDDLLGQVDIQHDLSTKQIGIDEKNEQVQKSLLGKKQQIGITQQDHLKDLDAELYAAQQSLQISNDAGQQGTVINEQLKEAAHQKAKALVLGQLALKDQERQANLAKDAAVQQQAGNQKLASLAQIRAQYEVQITQAIREGRIEVAKQLTAQKQIAELEAKIADFQKTPQQRQDELKEQQKHDQAQGTVISRQQDREARARELGGINAKEKKSLERLKPKQTIGKSAKEIRDMAKEQGVSEKPMTPEEIDTTLGRSDSTNRTSKSREKQLGDFLEEHAPAPADIAKIQKQDVGQMDVQKINLAMLQNAP